jgi:hypothetical protein
MDEKDPDERGNDSFHSCLQRDVLSRSPHIVTVMNGTNDSFVDPQQQRLKKLVPRAVGPAGGQLLAERTIEMINSLWPSQ